MTGLLAAGRQTEVWAAETGTGGYLQYQEPVAGGVSMLAYILSLLFVFVAVLVLAWLAARIFARRGLGGGNAGVDRILSVIHIAPNRSLMVVDALERILFLGVSEHNVRLLVEITDPAEVEKMRERYAEQRVDEGFGGMLGRQLSSLRGISRRYGG
ncbi:MAG: flagellar biosynthetic protein FliO [Negativicutes bacterium]|nr:flagellar biosynthetic protein FliO [Negativicutes bacterium]